jgi:hypothetical protein
MKDSGLEPQAVGLSIKGIANTAIQFDASRDLQAKLALLSACGQGTAPPQLANAAAASAATIRQELKQLGIVIS